MLRISAITLSLALLFAFGGALPAHGAASGSFMNFETAPIHPVDMSPDGSTLVLTNTAGGTLEIFDLSSGTPVLSGNVSVGVDPTSARFRSDTEVWVVNHISDSVNIVNLTTGLVVKTIQTLDEPSDVVFANGNAYVSCSQVNIVQVFDAADPGEAIAEIAILGEDPRAMAVSSDGSEVYVAIFESGNHSTVLFGGAGFDAPNPVSSPEGPYSGQNPPPNDGEFFFPEIADDFDPIPVALIVRKDASGRWMDDNDHDWTRLVSGDRAALSARVAGWDVVDNDVAIIDTTSNTVTGYIEGLMNICMAVAVNPATGAITVVGTDASNEVRFEPVVNGKFIKVLMGVGESSGKGAPTIVDLNPHLAAFTSFSDLTTTIDQVERDKALGDPRSIVWNAAGTLGYVTGMGSNNLIVIDGAGVRVNDIPLELPEGPTGMVLDEAREQLYVMNRMHASVSVIDVSNPGSEVETGRTLYFDPTPDVIRIGRKHLYDTHKNSGLGQIACASCHVDGRTDRLAWDLGNPEGAVESIDGENLGGGMIGLTPGLGVPTPFEDFNPMKGPMTTQTLQDIIEKEPLHWRGDKRGLEEFAGAFIGLQGDDTTLTDDEMIEFKNMVATIRIPPNPFRDLDNSIPDRQIDIPGQFAPGGRFNLPRGTPLTTGNPARGLRMYMGTEVDRERMDAVFNCVTCHTLPLGNGSDGVLGKNGYEQLAPDDGTNNHHVALVSVDGGTNVTMKIPQTRTVYDKTGMDLTNPLSRAGFGFLHDGTVDTVSTFFSSTVFSMETDQDLADMAALMMCFSGSDFGDPPQNPPDFYGAAEQLYSEPFSFQESSDAHAALGKQVTIDTDDPDRTMLNLFLDLADTGKVGLIAKGVRDGNRRGWLYESGDSGDPDESIVFLSDGADGAATLADLLATAAVGTELTFTIVADGTGDRLGLDRDDDGRLDFAEVAAGTDPGDPNFRPVVTAQETITTLEDTAIVIALNDITVLDEDNVFPDDFTLSVLDGPDYSHVGNEVTPDQDFNGELNVVIIVDDGETLNALKLASATDSILVTVTAVNDPPMITGQDAAGLTTEEETSITITLSDLLVTDVDNDFPADFSLTVEPGTNYTVLDDDVTPVTGFFGALSVSVKVNDGEADSNSFDLAVTVTQSEGTGCGAGGFTRGDTGRSRGDILLMALVVMALLATRRVSRPTSDSC